MKNNNKGQALLITIMLIAVALTVVLAMSYTSKTDVQLSKLEEENQQALAAAEAGIDALVSSNIAAGKSLEDYPLDTESFKNFEITAEKTSVVKTEFASPLLQPNGNYMLYLSAYPSFGSPYSGNITFYYSTKSSCTISSPDALEITLISGNSYPYTITRYVADGGNRLSSGGSGLSISQVDQTIDGVNFKCKTNSINIPLGSNPKLIMARSIFNPTRVGFEGSAPLPAQGTVISSEAKTSSGVSKKVQLFQSYPQIPADFFTTSF